ncbi:pre-peptidase C-terminal domain-containing protein [Aliikangiella sp. IMCC44359]|uniref:pre-peptidase C-terminal domain-containing protein n=1 Tax=Aliikangiella sp. IMCC44359 TaxID=3459125 RepID=UPI00403AE677
MFKPKKYIAPALIAMLCFNAHSATQSLQEQDLIYTTDQMFNFNIENYLNDKAPHLAPYAETISHWAGYSSISPKVLIALMEHQTSLVSIEDGQAMSRPFGDLSEETSFREQTRDVAMRLAKLHYQYRDNGVLQTADARSLTELISSSPSFNQSASAQNAGELFAEKFYKLFPANELTSSSAMTSQQNPSLVPPSNLLQLPYPVGSSWRYGGTHSNTGSGTVYSSLDLHNGGSWGSDLSNLWVKASAPGTVKRHSSCNMEVIHADGWSTQYYHLDNIQFSTNQSVSRNQSIANYASNKNQALCQGGQSTGPHQHFSLKRNGSYVSLNNVRLSGFRVNAGNSNYDTNCNNFWLESPNGQKNCAGTSLYNPGVGSDPDPDPDPTPGGKLQNGVAKTNLSANRGGEIVYTLAVPSGATNIKFNMSGGSGDADLYVKFGSKPTDSSYDCRPYKNGNSESCTGSSTGGTYYVRLKAYSSFSGVSIVGSYTTGGDPGNDPIDATETNISVSQGQWKRYTQQLAAGYSKMTITMSGGTGDADLYVNYGSQSTTSNYDCRPYRNGNNEVCTFNAPKAGTWYIDLRGYTNASGVTINLKAN